MEVAVQHHSSLVVKLTNQFLRIENCRVDVLMRSLPPSVQIAACERTPVVTVDHTVWVEHWYNFENELIPQHFCFSVVRIRQEEEHSSHHPRANDFSRVNTSGDDDGFLRFHDFVLIFLSDGEHLAVVARQRLTEDLPLEYFSALRVLFDFVQVMTEIGIGIRVREGEVDGVIVMLKLVTEAHRIVAFACISYVLLDAIGVIGYTVSTLMPACVLFSVCSFLGVDSDSHAIVEEAVWLGEVHQIKLHVHVLTSVLYLEEEPLGVAAGVDVVLH
mmetsp:Transcript_4423/g.6484  ORF Transcript_4423/g.6484 Transcript_4423/m.6484 type:complete len:273 (-) Transcript_4423:1520-2338(-)